MFHLKNSVVEFVGGGLNRFGGGKTLQQQLALALAQTGALDAARQVLGDLRDRFTVARELLTGSGSIIVQIGDENVHRVRALMDDLQAWLAHRPVSARRDDWRHRTGLWLRRR